MTIQKRFGISKHQTPIHPATIEAGTAGKVWWAVDGWEFSVPRGCRKARWWVSSTEEFDTEAEALARLAEIRR